MSSSPLRVLHQDDDYVVINKPSGMLVHPSQIAGQERLSCMTELRDQLGAWVYPVHRLDRATSGALVFALTSEAARALAQSWTDGQSVRKTYRAIVRGWVQEQGEVDRPLRETPDQPRVPARSLYRLLEKIEFPEPVGRYPSGRYSLVEVQPLTGRYHQIRKHLVGISHPIVGDTAYGDGVHNRYFREKFGIHRMLLSAHCLEFRHPRHQGWLKIEAPVPEEFIRVLSNTGS